MRGPCYPNASCDSGLSCLSGLCVVADTPSCPHAPPPRPALTAHTVALPAPLLGAVSPAEDLPGQLEHDDDDDDAEVVVHPLPEPVDEPPAEGTRTVVFRSFPPMARLRLDGKEVEANRRVHLPPGSYTLRADDRCCHAKTQKVMVQEGEGVQVVVLVLRFRDAMARLIGAPPSAVATCSGGIVLMPDSTTTVRLDELVRDVSCTFYPSEKKFTVRLRAGAETAIPWPAF